MSDILEPGQVALVGAGPGDPGLITLRGVRLLEQADVVIYDYLASPKLLAHAPNAYHLYVGKQASKHTMTQDQINALLIEKAQENLRVVRLKGGDPFVFGRGGEEAEALAQVGIKYIIVPGITAAIAAPAYAGIPVTHRDFNSSFTLITGHEKEDESSTKSAGASDLDWSAIAKLPCVAFYMGVKALPAITKKLIGNGKDPNTPAATIQWGTTSKQRSCIATVETIAEAVKKAKITAPAITIIGQVVSMREKLNWFESRPLYGQTIIVTRTRDQASDLSKKLEAMGARVIEAPTIEIEQNAGFDEVDAVLKSIMPDDYVVFTSANGVRAARDRMKVLHLDSRIFAGTKIAVIGNATARALRDQLCIEPDLIPSRAVAETLADELIASQAIAGKRFVLLRAEIARPILADRLTAAGALVKDVAIYQTKIAASLPQELLEALAGKNVQWITFTSSSTVKNFLTLLGEQYREKLSGIKLASIGPVTTQSIVAVGLKPDVVSDSADVGSLANAILNYQVR